MKLKYLLVPLLVSILNLSCNKNEEDENQNEKEKTFLDSRVPEFTTITKEGNIVHVKNMFTSPKNEKGDYVYTKFNLEKATYVTDDSWDIAFASRIIIINGGEWTQGYTSGGVLEPMRTKNASAAIIKDDYENITVVPSDAIFKQDGIGKTAIDDFGKGMFDPYEMHDDHTLRVKKNQTLLIKTKNGHYVKLKIEDLYKNGDTSGTMKEVLGHKYPYYTFKYFLNPVAGNKKLN
ncbi:HmuY family protein [Tenacibaculum piscium]|uniref:HmuY family protein n=1 Tax=Tenacibaculum piscium TaxID=1458515 RepID=UPI001EFA4F40|nr:HmuY family protein [Tenacibaculum piscium]MCG8184163.1 HmuY family protein [Tenacibaculum piscium]MCG8205669.1 HmuY family protein [Tenacibaculum piscium]